MGPVAWNKTRNILGSKKKNFTKWNILKKLKFAGHTATTENGGSRLKDETIKNQFKEFGPEREMNIKHKYS